MSHVARTEDDTFVIELSEVEAEILFSLCGSIGGPAQGTGRALTDELWEQFTDLDVVFIGHVFDSTRVSSDEPIPSHEERCGTVFSRLIPRHCILPPNHSGEHGYNLPAIAKLRNGYIKTV